MYSVSLSHSKYEYYKTKEDKHVVISFHTTFPHLQHHHFLPCTNRFTTLTPCWKVTLSRTNNRSVILVSNCFHSLQTTVNIPVCTNSVIVEQWGSSKVSIVPSPQAYEDSQCVLSADHTKVIRAVFYVRFIALTPCLKLYAFFWKTPVYIVIILSLSLITPNEAQKYVSL